MSKYKYNADIRKQYLDKMDDNLGPIFLSLVEEAIMLNAKWAEFKKLYAKSQERIDLLNKSASFFFRLIQDVLFEDIVLHLAKLTDKEKTLGKENLTVRRLPIVISDRKFVLEIGKDVQNCVTLSEFTIDRRNRLSAHIDLDLAMNEEVKPLEDINRKQIETAIQAINTLLNKIQIHYLESETFFELRALGSADDLIFELNYSIQQQENRKNRSLQGKQYPEDLNPTSNI